MFLLFATLSFSLLNTNTLKFQGKEDPDGVTKLTIGIFTNSTSAYFGLVNFLNEHDPDTDKNPQEGVLFFLPEHTVVCSELNNVLHTLTNPQSLAITGLPSKDYIFSMLSAAMHSQLEKITLMLDDEHPEYYLYIKQIIDNYDSLFSSTFAKKLYTRYYTTGDTPYTNLKLMDTPQKWDLLLSNYETLVQRIKTKDNVNVFVDTDKYHYPGLLLPHLYFQGTSNSQTIYYLQNPPLLLIPSIQNKISPLIEKGIIQKMDLVTKVLDLRQDSRLSNYLNKILGLSQESLSSYQHNKLPILFILGSNPFDKYYPFQTFADLMVQIAQNFAGAFSLVFVPHPDSCPLQYFTTYQGILQNGYQIYPHTLHTSPLALMMTSTEYYFGGWWDPLFFTLPPGRVAVFAGNVSYLSDGDADILGPNYFPPKVLTVTPTIVTTKPNWWQPWRIGLIVAAGLILSAIIVVATFYTITTEKANNEKDYILENAPTMGNVGGQAV